MDARIGQQLGNYRLLRLLGQGGFADVYLGEHVHLKMQAALKVLQVRLMGEHLELFRNEARTIASLVHPNIIRVFDFGVEAGTPFLVMDDAPHGSLRQRYPRGSIVPPRQIVTTVKQVAAALHYAHQKHFVHRDVKPENMLLGRNDEILLSDFGLVLVEQSTGSQITREAAGTLPYMAPEQMHGKPRAASDQYALGVVVYEWLCGERPFHGNPMELMGQHALTPPPPLRQRVPAIPHAVEAVVLKALSKEPQERLADVEAFANALERAYREMLAQTFPVADSLTNLRPPLNPTPQDQDQDQYNWPTSAPTYVRPTIQKQDIGHSSTPVSSANNVPISSPDSTVRMLPSSGTQTPLPGPLSSAAPGSPTRRISRRVVVASVAGAIGLGGSALALGWASSSGLLGSHDHSTPTPTPQGTVYATSTPRPSSPTTSPLVFPAALYTYSGHTDHVRAVAWSFNDQYIASAAGNVSFTPPAKDQTVQVWGATNGKHIYTYQGKGTSLYGYGASAVAWSPDSKRVASGVNDQSVEVWNALDGSNEFTYPGYGSLVNTVVWSTSQNPITSSDR